MIHRSFGTVFSFVLPLFLMSVLSGCIAGKSNTITLTWKVGNEGGDNPIYYVNNVNVADQNTILDYFKKRINTIKEVNVVYPEGAATSSCQYKPVYVATGIINLFHEKQISARYFTHDGQELIAHVITWDNTSNDHRNHYTFDRREIGFEPSMIECVRNISLKQNEFVQIDYPYRDEPSGSEGGSPREINRLRHYLMSKNIRLEELYEVVPEHLWGTRQDVRVNHIK